MRPSDYYHSLEEGEQSIVFDGSLILFPVLKDFLIRPLGEGWGEGVIPFLYNRIRTMQNRTPITKRGADKLRAELQRLKNDERPRDALELLYRLKESADQ